MPDWSGEICVLVASGPSARDVYLKAGQNKARFIAINRSWELCPWADVIYGCDFSWWKSARGLPEFSGLKLTGEKRASMEPWGINYVEISRPDDRLVMTPLGTVGSGSNSGFQCLNLAVQFGSKRIVLVGYDMQIDHGLHWHGPHPKGMNNPLHSNIGRWRRSVDNAASTLAKLGVTVINASQVSALMNYPKMDFEVALAEFRLA